MCKKLLQENIDLGTCAYIEMDRDQGLLRSNGNLSIKVTTHA
jgi:hypothetical protein